MICPFRVGAEFIYAVVKDSEGNDDYLQKEQRAVYPPCYEGECPYYNYSGSCERIGNE